MNSIAITMAIGALLAGTSALARPAHPASSHTGHTAQPHEGAAPSEAGESELAGDLGGTGTPQQKRSKVCGQSGFCRKNVGLRCMSSKNFFSMCLLLCESEQGFAQSQCFQKGAKK